MEQDIRKGSLVSYSRKKAGTAAGVRAPTATIGGRDRTAIIHCALPVAIYTSKEELPYHHHQKKAGTVLGAAVLFLKHGADD